MPEVISDTKEHFGPRGTVDDFRRALDEVLLSEGTLDAVDRQIEDRQRDLARPVKL
ncbi:MAG: hypothetical protein ACLF0P_07425 [Thermoanaerobaculia bacterium]